MRFLWLALTVVVACVVAIALVRARRPAAPMAASAAAATGGITAAQPVLGDVQGDVQAQRGTAIALLYASNLQGEYEHCGCPSHPLGGLARRATVIDRARAENAGVLIVDAGDMLLPAGFPGNDHNKTGNKLKAPDASEIERRAQLILSSYARMGVHAVLPAEGDLAIGPRKLLRLLKSLRVPAVASNLMDRAGRPIFERDRIVVVAGVPIGIFGVVQSLSKHQDLWQKWQIQVADPTATARAEIASLKARGAKMIVALLHLGPRGEAAQLLRDAPGINWAVQGHSGAQLETPETVGGARLVEAMSMGKLAGRLDIHLVKGVDGDAATFADKGERAQVLTIIADHRRQLVDIERRAAEDKTDQLRDYYKLRREGITAAIARETELVRKLPNVVAGSWYENRIIPLDESIPDHRGIALLISAYNAESARRAAAGLPVGVAMRDPRAAVPLPPPSASAPASASGAGRPELSTYAGSTACAGCHESAWKIFQTTKHARALSALVPLKRERDPTCVGCHSTGYQVPGGAATIREATTRLKDVGCESCHGPGLAHLTNTDKKRTTQRAVSESVCRGCHTPDQTNGEFEYESFRRAILGRGHGA
ncbi:MAG: hypothetical protein H7X95_06555 [Deltaproteobacteria bacterium]|nr:hypothetical protein [Deltaproteobacteria bacterium]